jgi:hypothetical protein
MADQSGFFGTCANVQQPPRLPRFEILFEMPLGDQAQDDIAQFQIVFADEPIVV